MHIKLGPFELTITFGPPNDIPIQSYDAVTDIPNRPLRRQLSSAAVYVDPLHDAPDESPGVPAEIAIEDAVAMSNNPTQFWKTKPDVGPVTVTPLVGEYGKLRILRDKSRVAHAPSTYLEPTAEESIEIARRAASDTYNDDDSGTASQ